MTPADREYYAAYLGDPPGRHLPDPASTGTALPLRVVPRRKDSAA